LAVWRDLDRFFGEPAWTFNPACDVEETENAYLLSFDLPGVSKENVKIEVVDNQLLVAGERKSEKKENSARHIVERHHGAFQRAFALPASVDTAKIEASFRDGVLNVTIPKPEAAKPRQIAISAA
jgi:HSP20 family protein